MEYIPIKTKVLEPPQANLLEALYTANLTLAEKDVILISSKVVAIHQGRTVPINEADKAQLITAEADIIIPRSYWSSPLTVVNHAFIGASGIDVSNGNGHYILLPRDIFTTAKTIQQELCQHYNLKQLGVVITDSHSTPFRYGAIGIALAWWGIEPLLDHIGRKDLFGRAMEVERSNVVDGLAAGATVVAGEVDECIPAVVARNVPRLIFTDKLTKDKLLVNYQEDTFRVLYEQWLK